MKILAIGNSFSQDATRYLHQIAEADGEDFFVVNLYIGGCALYRHYNNLMSDARAYSYEVNGRSTGIYVSIYQALRSQKWDIITLQQVSHRSPDQTSYQPYLDVLAAACRKSCPNAKLYIHETWAYEDNSKKLTDLGYKKSEDMFYDVVKAYAKAAKDIKADGMIPSGHAMKALVDAGFTAHRDTFHANLGFGRLALGLTWYAALTGKDVTKNTFAKLDEETEPKVIKKTRKIVKTLFEEPKKKKAQF